MPGLLFLTQAAQNAGEQVAHTDGIYSMLHGLLETFVNYSVTILELLGTIVIIVVALQAFYKWFQKDATIKLTLAEGLAFALELKLGAEILRTVIVKDITELIQIGAIIILRACLTFLIHWEIKNEKAHIEHE